MIIFERAKDGLARLCNSSDIEEAHREGETIYKYNDLNLIAKVEPAETIPEGFIEPFSIIVPASKE